MNLDSQTFPVVFLPDGRPAPLVLTADETASLLRLEGDHPQRCLKYWRDAGELKGVRLGKRIRYPLFEVLRFLTARTQETGSVCLASRGPGREKASFAGAKT